MDTTSYIESGILEAYVLGMLSHHEALEVEHSRENHSVIHKELLAIEDAISAYATRYAKMPPEGMKATIMEKIRALNTTPKSDVTTAKPGPSSSFNWKLPLSALLFGLLGALAFAFQNLQAKNKLSGQLDQQTTEMTASKEECDQVKAEKLRLENQLLFLRGIDNQTIRLEGTDKAPEAFATIYWNKVTRQSYLDVNSLPAPPAGKQYQLWAIVDGKPVDMKVFEVSADNNQLQKVDFIEKPQAFAVTLEDAGGNPTPTLTEMYVIGEIAG